MGKREARRIARAGAGAVDQFGDQYERTQALRSHALDAEQALEVAGRPLVGAEQGPV